MNESFELIDLGDAAVETRQKVRDDFPDNDLIWGLPDPSL